MSSDVREKAEHLAEWLVQLDFTRPPAALESITGGVAAAAAVRRLLHLLDTHEGRVRAEERAAWDWYAGGYQGSSAYAASRADELLAERRKRFNQGE